MSGYGLVTPLRHARLATPLEECSPQNAGIRVDSPPRDPLTTQKQRLPLPTVFRALEQTLDRLSFKK